MPEKRFFTVCATNAEKAEAQPVIQKRRKQGMRNPKAKKIVSLIIILALTVFMVLFSECKGLFERGLRKQLCAVEIIKAVNAVEPSAHIAVVRQRMANHLLKLRTRVAVKGGGITHRNSFLRLRHAPDVERESIWMTLTECPNLVSGGLDPVVFRMGVVASTARQRQAKAKTQNQNLQPHRCS